MTRYKLWNLNWLGQKRPIYVDAKSRNTAITKAIHKNKSTCFRNNHWSVSKIKPKK